ncbi:MAG: SusC/RagA family TonB-linked outer membrane protein [Cyclobacteriaceae bacterium]
MRKYYFSLLMFLLVMAQAFAQRTVTGKVTDESGEPLPGVNVVIKGTTTGTTTDLDGNYRLSVADGEILTYSFVGFESQETTVGNRSVIDMSMGGATELQEVVVTAVGLEREKKALGYSTTNITSDAVQQKAEGDIIRNLTAKIPGVNIQGSNGAPGSSTDITIRGASSLLGNNQPLFVVDGVPFDNSSPRTQNTLISGAPYSSRALDIDHNDVASITVLKGAAASALYGSRAANGVILITTKSGKGVNTSGLEVSFQTSVTIEEIAGIPDLQNKFSQGGTSGGGPGVFSNAFFGSWGASPNDIVNDPAIPGGNITDWQGNSVPLEIYPNNVADFFETGINVENSLSLRGGSENSNFSLTLSNLDTDGFIPNSELQRTNVKLGANTKLNNGLYVGGSLSYISTEQQGPPTGGGGVVSSGFSTQLWFIPRSYDPYEYPYIDENNQDNHYRTGEDHPLFSSFENPFTARVNRVFTTVNLGYDIGDNLNIAYRLGYDSYTQSNKQVFAPSSQFAPAGNITVDDIFFKSFNSDLIVTYTKDLNSDLNLRALVGHNMNDRLTDRQSFSGTGITVFGIDDLDNTQNVVPNGGTFSQRRLMGVYADISLAFRDYLFLGLVGRNDWSSTLPQNDNSFFYPAATLGFVFTDALNMQSNFLNFGKLRLAYGKVGNDAPVYSTQERLYVNPNYGTNLGALTFPFNSTAGLTLSNSLGNTRLTPEFTTEVEIGTELKFFQNKLALDVTYFDRTTTDQIFSVSRAPSFGFTSEILNAGEMSNKGIEIALNVTPINNKDGFKWDIYGTFTKIRSEVVALTDGLTRLAVPGPGSNFSTLGTFAVPGEPYGVIQGSQVARDSLGNRLIDPTTGYWITDPDNTTIIGDPNPDFIMGVSNTFDFKGLSLSFLVDWKSGGDLYAGTLTNMRGRGVLAETAEGNARQEAYILPGYLGDRNNPGTPLLTESGELIPNDFQIDANDYFWRTSSNAPQEFRIYDASVVRLREVSLSYSLPKSMLSDIFIGSASLTLVGRNLWFNAPNMPDGYDPETNGRGSGNGQGMEFAYVPNAKRYGASLKITF